MYLFKTTVSQGCLINSNRINKVLKFSAKNWNQIRVIEDAKLVKSITQIAQRFSVWKLLLLLLLRIYLLVVKQ